MPRAALVCWFLLVAPALAVAQGECPRGTLSAYAHNDYLNQRPLRDALALGFRGIEADVFLIDGVLRVGHDRRSAQTGGTLEANYLAPLQALAAECDSLTGDGQPFLLAVELKEASAATYDTLVALVKRYHALVDAPAAHGPAGPLVELVLVGWWPPAGASNRTGTSWLRTQYRIRDAKGTLPALDSNVRLLSLDYGKTMGRWWVTPGRRRRWQAALRAVKAAVPDRLVRVHNLPDDARVYAQLLEAGVDLLGTKQLSTSARLLRMAQTGDWRAYGHDAAGSRFSPLTQIDRSNVARLEVAWTYHTGEPLPNERRRSLEVTPLVVNGAMFIATPLGKIAALEPTTGREKWVYDAKVDASLSFGDFTTRGVSVWGDRVIFATTDGRLIALDTARGRPIASFGAGGTVNLRAGLRNAPYETAEYEVTSPPAIINGLIVVGSAVADNGRSEAASGEVRAYDARTGALRWTWDPVPQNPSDPAYATWQGPRAHHTGAANVWSVIAADSARDMVYVPTSAPSPDYYGGERLGRNEYANSIVALRASTGRVVWHFQTVHHDLWDYDNASPPLLATVKGQPAVLQATKTGMLYVLNRETGAPIFPVEERPVPASRVPGERAWPTQPFSTLPPLSPHAWDPSSLSAECQAMVRGYRNEGIFTPPSLEGTLVIPSNVGGAHWGGLTFDPVRQLAIVPVNRLAAMVQLIPAEGANLDSLRRDRSRVGYEDTRMRGTPYIMRRRVLFIPPATTCTPGAPGALVALDLSSGTKVWESPLAPQLGGPIATAGGVVFIAATMDAQFRAFDVQTGALLWSAPLPAGGKATPMTYLGADGRQYVVIAAGGDGKEWGASDAIVAYALPR